MEEDEGEKKQLGVTNCLFLYVCKAVQTAVSESASPKRFGFFRLLVFTFSQRDFTISPFVFGQ